MNWIFILILIIAAAMLGLPLVPENVEKSNPVMECTVLEKHVTREGGGIITLPSTQYLLGVDCGKFGARMVGTNAEKFLRKKAGDKVQVERRRNWWKLL